MMEQKELSFQKTKDSQGNGLKLSNLPESIDPKKILAKSLLKHTNGAINPSQAEKISANIYAKSRRLFQDYRKGGLEPMDADKVAKDLSYEELIKTIKKIDIKKLAKNMLNDYEQALTQNYKGYIFPCDELIKSAITHIETFRRLNPESLVYITSAPSRFYVEACLLYGQVLRSQTQQTLVVSYINLNNCALPESKFTDSFSLFGKSRPVENFKKLLEERKALFEVNKQSIDKIESNIIIRPEKTPSPPLPPPEKTKEQYIAELTNKISDPTKSLDETDWKNIKQEAAEGEARLQIYLGECYYDGKKGLPRDFEQAVYWFKQAAAKDLPRGQYYLGLCYLEGHGVQKDIKVALSWFEKAADRGDVLALLHLGSCYLEETEVPKDTQKAFSLFEKAANAGNSKAQLMIGVSYKQGDGVTQDDKNAVFWFQKAAAQGDPDAQYFLGLHCYDGKGCPIDLELAVHWYQQAAKQGNRNAQRNLGMCYYQGHGVAQDFKQAAHWYQQAANQGDLNAKFYLGVCYFKGQGVTKDIKQASALFEAAVIEEEATAEFMVGKCYQEGGDDKQAIVWFQKAADRNYGRAQYELGLCYLQGKGVTKNVSESLKWLQKAASQGNDEAKQFLNELAENINQSSGTSEESTAAPSQFGKLSPALHKQPSTKPSYQQEHNESKQEKGGIFNPQP